jgi:diguanylate cyclase (GGDEF)-like protein
MAPSIGSSLALLVAACILPAALVSAYVIVADYRAQRAQLLLGTVVTARALTSTLDRDLASLESALHVLAASPLLAADDLEGFYRQAKDVVGSQNANNYVLTDSQGSQIINTMHPFGAPLPKRPASDFERRVYASDRTTVSGMFPGSITHLRVIAVGVPVHRKGKTMYALNVGIAAERVAALLQGRRLPAGWVASVFDSKGILIARTRDMNQFVGRKVSPIVQQAAQEHPEGTVETLGLDGIPVITAFSRSDLANWTVAVDIPLAAIQGALRRSLWLLIGSTAALLCAGLWLAWHRGDRIATAIRGLIGPALELGCGTPLNIPPLHLKEADEVAQALTMAAQLLQNAQRGAQYDLLTGLANRALFHEMLDHQLAICERMGHELSVLHIDLDGFKSINDLHGHAVGDELLRAIAARIKGGIRGSDIAARWGGDEFVILLIQSGGERARMVAEKLALFLSAPYDLHQLEIHVSASIGVATFPASADSGAALLLGADIAMHAAKKSGKNSFAVAVRADTA